MKNLSAVYLPCLRIEYMHTSLELAQMITEIWVEKDQLHAGVLARSMEQQFQPHVHWRLKHVAAPTKTLFRRP